MGATGPAMELDHVPGRGRNRSIDIITLPISAGPLTLTLGGLRIGDSRVFVRGRVGSDIAPLLRPSRQLLRARY
jgi:hypothetical protein